ncbi:MAG: hypothetical protein PHW18_02630 [Sulfuricurvum sp.]|uniref:hypothetical protein n=1 Tax=Sulfuricurvum sp. TaxID=2025608 RepID=UPI002638D4D2|nr:hypothetical protein [Sulfuricurvum sp.]MDD2828452.1 hypothetical protein [Sulfuricurvum sp.]MDD4949457.1 hypothetical protein [Sulfuricurvum sp.]
MNYTEENAKKIETTALKNQSNELFEKINLISLGETALSTIIPTRWGIVKTKEEGRLPLVFDSAIHFGQSVLNILENKFEGCANEENFHYSTEHKIWKNTKYSIVFNHSRDFSGDDLQKLIKLYTKRIENFTQVLKNKKKSFFLYSTIKTDFSDFEGLKKALSHYSNDFHLIIVNHRNILLDIKDPLITIIDAPFPSEEYTWHLPSCYLSDEGIAFEETLISQVIDVIQSVVVPVELPKVSTRRRSKKAKAKK